MEHGRYLRLGIVCIFSTATLFISLACTGESDDDQLAESSDVPRSTDTPQAVLQELPASIDFGDEQAVAHALGGESPDTVLDVAGVLSSLPDGTTATAVGPSATEDDNELRYEHREYELQVPGEPARAFTISRVHGRHSGNWALIGIFVGNPE